MAGKTNGGLTLGSSSPIKQKAEQTKAPAAQKATGAIEKLQGTQEHGKANPIITAMGR